MQKKEKLKKLTFPCPTLFSVHMIIPLNISVILNLFQQNLYTLFAVALF